MSPLCNFNSLRLGFSTSSSTFASKYLKPSHFPPHIQILCGHLTSKIPETHHSFTVNYLINSCGLSPEGAISASKWVELRSPKIADSFLSFLRNHGFSATQISKVVRSCPQLLYSNPEKTLLPKLEFFRSTGVSREALVKTLAYDPHILAMSLEKRITPTYNFLRSIISEKNFVAFLKGGSRIFLEGHSKNVAPNIEILRELGMPQSRISLLLTHFPTCLLRKPEDFGRVVDEVKQMGFNLETSMSVMAIKALCSRNSKSIWNRNSEAYKRWGWSDDEVLAAFRQFPQCMTKSEKKITQVMELLVNKMGWPLRMITKYPVVMSLSLEKRIIPRCKVVKVLRLKGLVNIENLSLSTVFLPTEKKFLDRFVTSYLHQVPQIVSVYHGNVLIQDV
ncbi:transcription termination factor MTERF2, chloroplastic-like [Malus sylvestris]|uniref:transcription termination factor MTERF2, chloroplastic-like n=1 Tax=Malus sylvestris TaxID=3752 RepID=UPI0021AD1FA1|nr:transcription termination factor MTERF2, chloroplastic-like [Malus sylvestris]XP_050137705.1 transcription termination factor MTERF2, chloroplastic-like [Malus sylvestris]XP_050137706.1 transcription termination factor MTERF2, chloroplastic-like [Malus sylvestris]